MTLSRISIFLSSLFLSTLLVPVAYGQEWKSYHLVSGCSIYDFQGHLVRRFVGDYCLYLDDGRVVSRTISSLTMYDKNSSPLWTLKGFFHHQMSMTQDGEKILAIGGLSKTIKDQKAKIDRLLVISLKGEILHETTSDHLIKQVLKEYNLRKSHQEMTENLGTSQEISHFNSIYEIPKLIPKDDHPFFKEGHIIVNGLHDGVFILSPDLKVLKHHSMLPLAHDHLIHDAQILPNGNMIFFNNMVKESTTNGPSSAVQEYNFSTQKVIHHISAEPSQFFFSRIAGSVQKLDEEHFLFTHYLLGTYIYSVKKKTIIHYLLQTHIIDRDLKYTQQVKAVNLTTFLTHWK